MTKDIDWQNIENVLLGEGYSTISKVVQDLRAAKAQSEKFDVISSDKFERAAKEIYKAMRYERETSTPPWVERGNSFSQEIARDALKAVVRILKEPSLPQPETGKRYFTVNSYGQQSIHKWSGVEWVSVWAENTSSGVIEPLRHCETNELYPVDVPEFTTDKQEVE